MQGQKANGAQYQLGEIDEKHGFKSTFPLL